MDTALTAVLAANRTLTAKHLTAAMAEQHGITMSTLETRKYLATSLPCG
jgi:hypothetical protein